MELLSRRKGYVSVECAPCRVSLTLPEATWDAAKDAFDTLPGLFRRKSDRRKKRT
jgi:hypothetical protein